MKELLFLFWSFFKIGLTTFGGGYAMIPIVKELVVDKTKWISDEEFVDMIGICESTPGPIAINMATFVGYKQKKFLGSLFATLGVVLPSLIIIFVISLFFDWFLGLKYVQYAFTGIKVCVGFLILKAGIQMFKKMEKKVVPLIIFSLTIIASIVLELFNLRFSSIFMILIGGFIGFLYCSIVAAKKGDKKC